MNQYVCLHKNINRYALLRWQAYTLVNLYMHADKQPHPRGYCEMQMPISARDICLRHHSPHTQNGLK